MNQNTLSQKLTDGERERFTHLRQSITVKLRSAVEVGEELHEIRTNKLFREDYSDWDSCCRQEWGMGRNYADKMITMFVVIQNLGTTVPILPSHETQTRHLGRLEPAEQIDVWQACLGFCTDQQTGAISTPTEELIRQVALERYPKLHREDGFFLPTELEQIRHWLEERRNGWPEPLRTTFAEYLRRQLDFLEDDATHDDRRQRLGQSQAS